MSKIWHTRTVKYYSIIQQRKEWTADTNHMNEPWKHAKWKKRLHLVWFPWYEMSRIDTSSSSVAQSCPTLCEPVDRSTPGFPVQHQLLELTQTHVHRVGDAILPSHLLSPSPLPSIFPSIRVFSNEPVLHIRWPKYWRVYPVHKDPKFENEEIKWSLLRDDIIVQLKCLKEFQATY